MLSSSIVLLIVRDEGDKAVDCAFPLWIHSLRRIGQRTKRFIFHVFDQEESHHKGGITASTATAESHYLASSRENAVLVNEACCARYLRQAYVVLSLNYGMRPFRTAIISPGIYQEAYASCQPPNIQTSKDTCGTSGLVPQSDDFLVLTPLLM